MTLPHCWHAVPRRRQQREAVAALRRKHRIHVSPLSTAPDPMTSFDDMPKSTWVKTAGCSGKTIAFLGPILACLGKPGKDFARALIVDPSRELAMLGCVLAEAADNGSQGSCAKLRKLKWNGRLVDRMSGQKAGNIKRLDVAVATPLRLVQMLRENRSRG
eukprot:Skav211704  [mRNA]  locus=scaffold4901:6120:8267:+ [translate_table: standard]